MKDVPNLQDLWNTTKRSGLWAMDPQEEDAQFKGTENIP